MAEEAGLVEVSCMPKGQPKYKIAYRPGAMHRLLCEDGPLYVFVSPASELIMIRENELCPSCGGTGACANCKGSGKVRCEECNGTGRVRLIGLIPLTCRACNGTGLAVCPNCNGRGLCPDCMGRRHKTPRTPAKK